VRVTVDETLPIELKAALSRFETVLDTVSGLRVIEAKLTDGHVALTCRDHDANRWTKVMTYFIANSPAEWDSLVFVARRFLRVVRNGQPTVAYAWFLSFRSPDLPGMLEQVGGLLTKADHFRRTGKTTSGPGAVDFSTKVAATNRPGGHFQGRKYGENELPEIGDQSTKRVVAIDPDGFKKTYVPTGTDHRVEQSNG
jgi:hypothetical protein